MIQWLVLSALAITFVYQVFKLLRKWKKDTQKIKPIYDVDTPSRPEKYIGRKVFNVDVGGMSHKKAEKYIRTMNRKYKKNVQPLTEDFWFATNTSATPVSGTYISPCPPNELTRW